jgi:hypothetical protein
VARPPSLTDTVEQVAELRQLVLSPHELACRRLLHVTYFKVTFFDESISSDIAPVPMAGRDIGPVTVPAIEQGAVGREPLTARLEKTGRMTRTAEGCE